MQKVIIAAAFFTAALANAQYTERDTLQQRLQEVIVIGTAKVAPREAKPLSSIDEYLQKSARVNMLKRGAYAWEPLINNMPTERTLVTIDGMRIFGACTDKMDPITSYVEISNLSEAEVSSGQQGACHGTTIGGAIDLKRTKPKFGAARWSHYFSTGFESVNQQKIIGAGSTFKNIGSYVDVNFMYRDAENYTAGNGAEIPFSQFRKYNISGIAGIKIGENNLAEASLIYDKASDVGYPALPMDVSLAEALITSLKFQTLPKNSFISGSETKIYYNTITHRMDDTKRPAVAIHMDMPGWSRTAGYYTHLKTERQRHHLLLNVNGYFNKSTAEMTMYPNNKSEPLMFMYTWPAVKTFYQAIYLEDDFKVSDNSALKVSAGAAFHRNEIGDDFGLNSLQIFYANLESGKNRLLKNLSAQYRTTRNAWEYRLAAGYGDRAPSVSEGYGFYLFNSSEQYDYVGNPGLKNESALDASAALKYKISGFSSEISATYFHISNYIVGEVLPGLAPMTIGAKGVKKYTALPAATLYTLSWQGEIQLLPELRWAAQAVYSRGSYDQGENLPFISPFRYDTSFKFSKNKLSAEISAFGNSAHSDYAQKFGENFTAPYILFNGSAGYLLQFEPYKIVLKAGVENIFDRYYTTYADWNSIPRPGRNIFLNMNISF